MGISPNEWENLTPAVFRAFIDGYFDRQKEQADLQRVQNYNLAVMIRSAVWAKIQMPDYSHFCKEGGDDGKPKIMSDEQMYQQVLALNAALGGSVAGG